MKINIINAATDLGVHVDGSDKGPLILSHEIENNKKIDSIITVKKKDIIKSHDPKDLEKNLKYVNEFNERLYKEIKNTKDKGLFPLTIGGDHSLAIASALASIKTDESLGIIWVDAHGDYNTFATTKTGNLHGLPLAANDGLCQKLTAFHDGAYFKPENTVIFGGRDIDPWEMPVIKENHANLITTQDIKEKEISKLVKEAVTLATKNTNGIHLSLDLDVIDPVVAPGVSVPAKDGIDEDEFLNIVRELLKYKDQIKSIDLVEFNPTRDIDDKTKKIALKTLEILLEEL